MTPSTQTQAESAVTAIETPIRLTSSHGIARSRFESVRKAQFTHDGSDLVAAPLEMVGVEVLGVALRRLALRLRDSEWYLLRIEFTEPQTMESAQNYLRRLSDAFTTSMASGQRDPWYGNLVLDVGWAGVTNVTPQPMHTVSASVGSRLTHEHFIPIDSSTLQALRWTPFTEVFADGMRAAQSKAKFLYWFIILEELERREEFKRLFKPLFTPAEKEKILESDLMSETKRRLEQLLNKPNTTKEGRAQKLFYILREIGLIQIQNLSSTINVDKKLCCSLIKQRNIFAHEGKTIDKDLLYNVLFPLAQGALSYLSVQTNPSRNSR